MSQIQKDDDRNSSSKEEKQSCSLTAMFLYMREIVFLFALVFTSYAALFNSLPKIGKPPPAVPFFSRSSPVVDFYKGEIKTAFQQAMETDLTIIMYYAPWDAESQAARSEYEAAALLLHPEVTFMALSCWAPSSDCKQQYAKLKQFPVIVGYPQFSKGIDYKGPITSVHIAKFARTLMRPLHRVTSPLDIVHLIYHHDAVVVGSFLFSGNLGGPGFYTFYMAAQKMVEVVPTYDVAFAVTTDRSAAAEIEAELVPSVRMYLWNETLDYPGDGEYTDEAVTKWVWENLHGVVSWVLPPGVKSRYHLSPYTNTGPVMVVFTPRNPLDDVNPVYSLVQELSLRYNNCQNTSWISSLARYTRERNAQLRPALDRAVRRCRSAQLRAKMASVTSLVVMGGGLNGTAGACEAGCAGEGLVGPRPEACVPKRVRGEMNRSRTSYSYQTSMLTGEGDPRAPPSLLHHHSTFNCQLLEAGQRYSQRVYPATEKHQKSSTIEKEGATIGAHWNMKEPAGTNQNEGSCGEANESQDLTDAANRLDGLACSTNRSLAIIVMDSMVHFQFAEGLGVHVSAMDGKTAVVIIDIWRESQYLLSKPLSRSNLVDFIYNHTQGLLERHRRGRGFESPAQTSDGRSLTRLRRAPRDGEDCRHSETESCIVELDARGFELEVVNTSRATVVLYHSPYCAFCRSISHVILLIARHFRHFAGLHFVRIDGDGQDLPWEFTMDSYPSILFLPTFRKAESRVFSQDLPFTVRNLIHFVLANLEPEAKIPGMLSLCISFQKLQDENEARKCKSKIQKATSENMSNTLKDIRVTIHRWRNLVPDSSFAAEVRKRRKSLIRKLAYFQNVSLLLGSIDKIEGGSPVVTKMFHLYDEYLCSVNGGGGCR